MQGARGSMGEHGGARGSRGEQRGSREGAEREQDDEIGFSARAKRPPLT